MKGSKKLDETSSSDSESSDSDAIICKDSSDSKVDNMEDNFEGSAILHKVPHCIQRQGQGNSNWL